MSISCDVSISCDNRKCDSMVKAKSGQDEVDLWIHMETLGWLRIRGLSRVVVVCPLCVEAQL